jgi:hypothetical protein
MTYPMKTCLLTIALAALAAAGLPSCTCEEEYALEPTEPLRPPFRVVEVRSLYGENVMSDLRIRFNRPIDDSSFEPGVTIRFDNVEYTGSYDFLDNGTTLGLQQCAFLCPDQLCEFDIVIEGGGSIPLRSIAGELLDGDDDGSAGGRFRYPFATFNCQFPRPPTVVFPDTTPYVQPHSGTGEPLYLQVFFSDMMDYTTIVPEQTIRLACKRNGEPIEFFYDNGSGLELYINTPMTYAQLHQKCLDPATGRSILLLTIVGGQKPNAFRAVNGLPLDGRYREPGYQDYVLEVELIL